MSKYFQSEIFFLSFVCWCWIVLVSGLLWASQNPEVTSHARQINSQNGRNSAGTEKRTQFQDSQWPSTSYHSSCRHPWNNLPATYKIWKHHLHREDPCWAKVAFCMQIVRLWSHIKIWLRLGCGGKLWSKISRILRCHLSITTLSPTTGVNHKTCMILVRMWHCGQNCHYIPVNMIGLIGANRCLTTCRTCPRG